MNDYIENNRRPFTGLASLFYIDLKLFMPIVIITIIGLVTIYSSSSGDIALVLKQLTRILIGVIVMIFIAQVHPDNLKLFAPILYFFTLNCFLIISSIFLDLE